MVSGKNSEALEIFYFDIFKMIFSAFNLTQLKVKISLGNQNEKKLKKGLNNPTTKKKKNVLG